MLCNLMDYSLPGSSVHGILQERILEWVAFSFSRGSSQLRDRTCVSCIGRQILHHWATWGACDSHWPSHRKMRWNLDANPWLTLYTHMRWFPWLLEHNHAVPFRGQQRACLGLYSPTHDMTSGWRAKIFLKCNNINYQLTLTHVWCMCAFISQEWYKD